MFSSIYRHAQYIYVYTHLYIYVHMHLHICTYIFHFKSYEAFFFLPQKNVNELSFAHHVWFNTLEHELMKKNEYVYLFIYFSPNIISKRSKLVCLLVNFILVSLNLFWAIREPIDLKDIRYFVKELDTREMCCLIGTNLEGQPFGPESRSDPNSKQKTETELTFWHVLPYFVHSEPFQSKQKQKQGCTSHIWICDHLWYLCPKCDQTCFAKKNWKKNRACDWGHKCKIVRFCNRHKCHTLSVTSTKPVSVSVWNPDRNGSEL